MTYSEYKQTIRTSGGVTYRKKYDGKINISVVVFSIIGRNHIFFFFSEIKQNVLDRDYNASVGRATGNKQFFS